MNFTHSILKQMGYKLDPDGNYSRTETNTPRVSNPKPKPVARKALPNTNEGKENSKKRSFVRITRYSCRPLDCDNYAGGCKPLIDQLRYAKLIRDDDPESVQIEFIQVKVPKKTEERTEIEIKQL
jgi:Holliday junction resolvase RusA-like endonuclease